MSRKGPFGLWMGMTLGEIEGAPEEVAPCKYRIATVPKPHSAFERYVCRVTPKLGLSWLKAIGKDVQTNGYGIDLKTAFDSMESKLAATYGKFEKHDFLMHDSIWNEPRDWMQAVQKGERILMSQWSMDSNAVLTDSLTSVALVIGAYNSESGYIAIEYSFENSDAAEAEIAALEDDAL